MREHVHFIGIGGIGMSALALVLADSGISVSGSDRAASYVLESLKKKGIKIHIGQHPENIQDATKVIFSTDVPMHNPECREALKKGIPLMHRSQLLAELLNSKVALLVAGTHGKTTTSSLLAHVLSKAGFDPSYAIGGIVHSLESNGGGGQGKYFVAEADESDGSFLKYMPWGAILTNIDNDHMEYWKSDAELLDGFRKFAAQVISKEHLFWCKDDDNLNSLHLPGFSYGFSEDADLCIQNYIQFGWKNVFECTFLGKFYQLEIPLIGAHNVLNATAVFGLALQLGIPAEVSKKMLMSFSGIARRVEKKGEAAGILFYDDYAHHPTEILATLRALRTAAPKKRLVVAFQPHRYTRVRDCMEQFPLAFEPADVVVMTDIFSAGEQVLSGVTTEALLSKIHEKIAAELHYAPRETLIDFLREFLQPGDIFVTMGAGDITKVGSALLAVR